MPHAWVTLELITAERVDLYSYVIPPGANIPISMEPLLVNYSVPTEDKIKWAVKRLQNHRSGGPSGIQAEHLRVWIAAARKKKWEEAAAKQEKPTEGRMIPGPDRTGREMESR